MKYVQEKLPIAIDYDQTITNDVAMWLDIIKLMQSCGHAVIIVTMRYNNVHEQIPYAIANAVDYVFYTGRRAKRDFLAEQRVYPKIWIDDCPDFILNSALG
jgi:hypothetical protein